MNGALIASVVLSLVSAVAYAAAAVVQERLAARSTAGLLKLLATGAWWTSVALNAGGAVLHVAALTYGPLTVVQPLGALTLVAAVPLGARRAGRRVSRAEWQGTALTIVGLALILVAAAGSDAHKTLTLPQALVVAGVTGAAIGLLTRGGRWPGLRHATASGVSSGIGSALTPTVTVAATARGGGVMPAWQIALVAVLVAGFSCGGLLLSQSAYRAGLGAPLAVLTLANPVAAASVGLLLLGEELQGGAVGIAAAAAGAVVAGRGVVLLTHPGVSAAPPPPPETATGAGTRIAPPSCGRLCRPDRPRRSWVRPWCGPRGAQTSHRPERLRRGPAVSRDRRPVR